MKLEFNKDHNIFHDVMGEQIFTAKAVSSANNILINQLGYRHIVGIGDYMKGLYITSKNLNKHFDPAENLQIIDFDRTNVGFINYHQCFKSKSADYFIIIDRDLSVNWEDDFVISDDKVRVSGAYYNPTKIEDNDKLVEELGKLIVTNHDSSSKVSLVIRTSTGYVFKQRKIKPLQVDVDKMYNDDFAPVYDRVVDKLNNTEKGIVLFHGLSGTGKTSILKHLTTKIPNKDFVFIPVSMIAALTDPSFLGQLIDNKNSVLILEDCENYLKDRGQTENSVVSSILNLSDGILSDILGIQIIATFNADLTKVDEALLRKGRLIEQYEFKELAVEKCQRLVDDMGIDVTIDKEMTLSDVFNIKDEVNRTTKKQNKIGFR